MTGTTESEHVIEYIEFLAKKMNHSIMYSEYIAENLEMTINYMEYLESRNFLQKINPFNKKVKFEQFYKENRDPERYGKANHVLSLESFIKQK